MLGHALCDVLGNSPRHHVIAVTRGPAKLSGAAEHITGINALDADDLGRALSAARPDAVVNAVGLIKQLSAAKDPLQAIPVNSLLPHRLALLCGLAGARLVHISTDCVFTGQKGGYAEDDLTDATDLYGISKRLGEVVDDPNAVTLRTSIIGHEKNSRNGLIEWFVHAGEKVQGFRKVFFSGLPTVVLAQVIADHVLPNTALSGLYHVSAAPIDKLSLLEHVRDIYGLSVRIIPTDTPEMDRSLNSNRFQSATGWRPEPWPELVARMKTQRI